MSDAYTRLYVHLAWATWERLPMLTPQVAEAVRGAVLAKCVSLRCEALAVGGMEDHLHVLVRHTPVIAVSKLVGELKGASSHFVNHRTGLPLAFQWQRGYGAFTLRSSEVPLVERYILEQVIHHGRGTVVADWEHLADDR